MTDNGPAYKSHAHARAVAELGIKHLRTRPYGPGPTAKQSDSSRPSRANGPTPRLLDSAHRRHVLCVWLEYYNCRRPHSALGHKPPVRALRADERS